MSARVNRGAHPKRRPVSGPLAALAVAAWMAAGSWQLACGQGKNDFERDGSETTNPEADGGALGDATLFPGIDGDVAGVLSIQPPAATIDVLIDGTGVHAAPVTFVARASGAKVAPTWTFDRAELGSIAPSGVFTPSAKLAGTGTITALYGGVKATATVSVRIHSIQNGAPPGAPPPDKGGVGGEGLGGKVDDATIKRLRGGGPPSDVTWLYPYDRTVWPRGILAPLLQWKSSHAATSVYIHLQQADFEFEGFYSGAALVHQPIDATAWSQALQGNSGDPLRVSITIADAGHVYGPIPEEWSIAPGLLKGTLYYNSYNTMMATKFGSEPQAAAVLAIQSKAGGTELSIAIPGTEKHRCVACHTISADGSTLFAEEASGPWPAYGNSASFDLRKAGALIRNYTGNAPDGTTNNRKFLWSGPSPDGTYALQSAGHTQECYGIEDGAPVSANVDSHVFRRDNGSAVKAAGFDGIIKEAVTPSFSPDGTRIAFSYWTAVPGANAGVPEGAGHTLDVMDFACGGGASGAGAPSCSSFTFSNLRRVYTNPDITNGFPAWPAWLADGVGIVFHNTVTPASGDDSPISTWQGAQAELWFADVPKTGPSAGAVAMYALNGKRDPSTSYLPTNANHPNDTVLNYEPTVNPVASGGYYWVVFTSRRMYGNVATGDPYEVGDGTYPVTKKLWVAAVDLHPTPGKDPSHPAFYLPGQELNAGNMRGYWVVDPCKSDGSKCESGDECCNGFCRQPDDGGAPVCMGKPEKGCAQEFEKCTTTGDCCLAAAGYQCLNGHCARPAPK
jgi:hypothetical protein